jgi:hypothetical protein
MRGRSVTSTRRLLELVGEAHAFEDLDEFRPGILEVLNRAVPSLWVSYNEVNLDHEQTFALSLPPLPSDALRAFARLSHKNPILAEFRRTGDGRPRRISDVMDQPSFRRLALYQEFYAPLGIASQIAFTLPAPAPLVLGIALSRGDEDFSDEEAGLLALARPYLIQAYRNAELSSARTAALRAVESGLETLGRHVVVLDHQGRIEFATDTAATARRFGRRSRCAPGRCAHVDRRAARTGRGLRAAGAARRRGARPRTPAPSPRRRAS